MFITKIPQRKYVFKLVGLKAAIQKQVKANRKDKVVASFVDTGKLILDCAGLAIFLSLLCLYQKSLFIAALNIVVSDDESSDDGGGAKKDGEEDEEVIDIAHVILNINVLSYI